MRCFRPVYISFIRFSTYIYHYDFSFRFQLVVVDIDLHFDYVSFFGALPTHIVPDGLCVALWSDLGLEPYVEINGIRIPKAPDAFIIRPNESIALYHLE